MLLRVSHGLTVAGLQYVSTTAALLTRLCWKRTTIDDTLLMHHALGSTSYQPVST